jgi:GT2 family glycosyltransferase
VTLVQPVPTAATTAPRGPLPGSGRPRVDGKFLAVGERRLTVRGVTYGTFAPGADGARFPAQDQVVEDFRAMAAAGVNAVRVYTVPPRRVLDAALAAGVWVLVGVPWTQHVTFLDRRRRAAAIRAEVAGSVATCAGHPAILGYAVGNEVPAGIVRWHGRRRVERFLDALCRAACAADRGALVTYVSFPSTEYLRVRAADVVAYNVYIEDQRRFEAYVARLQNLAGERPLLIAEAGIDSARHGRERQASALRGLLGAAYTGGCAGAFAFAWTDEWHRGDDPVLDWDFGVCDRDRRPKPALDALSEAFADAPAAPPDPAPLISVVVCTHNGAATLRECLAGARALRYPRFELIVVDDGSTDSSAAIGRELGARVISTPNRGLSAARNTGMDAAAGAIIAYLDDDAFPDPDWLTYLALGFATTGHAAMGGPNVPPPDTAGAAACVANSPGGPVHVLIADTEAEHLPGCNLAFRRDELMRIGGFDEQFRVAGDDVDVCWRLADAGGTLGFHPAALVWHRRRGSVSAYWRQQRGYGRAEALLERKWPEKYNVPGHARWGGRLYGRGTGALVRRTRIYHGRWGTAPFQAEVERPGPLLAQLAATPEWHLVCAALTAVALLGLSWRPLLAAVPLLVLAAAAALGNAVAGALRAPFAGPACRQRLLTLMLHLLQPAARLAGRAGHGLVPWRRPRLRRFAPPAPRVRELWSETWRAPEERIARLHERLRAPGGRVRAGGPCDRWDLEVAGGALGAARVRTVVEDHGRGRQLLRCRIWPRVPRGLVATIALLAAGGAAAAHAGAWLAGAVLEPAAILLLVAAVAECSRATAAVLDAAHAVEGAA